MTVHTLYLLHEGPGASAHERLAIVRDACARAGIAFVAIDSLAADYAKLPELMPGDMLFNSGRGSVRLETLLMRPHVATFRTCGTVAITNGSDTTVHCAVMETLGLPVPRTIHRLPADNERLADYVAELGGFPVIVKASEGTLGVGVMIVESMRSLRSILDFLRTTGREFVMRQYIAPKHVARLLVLGGKVVASLRYAIDGEDFRGLPLRRGAVPMDFGAEAEALAIEASRAARHDFTGVDLLIDQAGKPWVLEVNGPSNFVAYEALVGLPIGDLIVAHLREKAEAILASPKKPLLHETVSGD